MLIFLLDIDTNITNIGGGVGEAYPGSTGGEIFNCYENSTAPVIGAVTRNQAAGYYSTASGVSNKANGDISWVAGFNNTVSDTSTPHLAYGHLVLGGNNKITPSSSDDVRSCTVGFYNNTNGGNHNCVFGVMNVAKSKEDYFIGGGNQNNGSFGSNLLCGLNNVIPNTNARSGTYLFGQNLHISKSSSGPQHLVVVGKGSNATINVPNSKSSLGAAITGGGSTNFNIECYPTYTKMDLPLRLPSDETQVNAIEAPVDPSNPTTAEQTLATLGSIQALKDAINNAHLQRRQLLLTGQITELNTGTSYNLENTFNITIPSWANRLRLGCQFGYYGETQGYVEFGLVAGKYTYTALNGSSNSFFAANFSYSSKVLTVNKCMRLQDSDDTWDPTTTKFAIISITAYGNFSF